LSFSNWSTGVLRLMPWEGVVVVLGSEVCTWTNPSSDVGLVVVRVGREREGVLPSPPLALPTATVPMRLLSGVPS